ncbi:unnamed protein product [Caenorhabditis brenneri]
MGTSASREQPKREERTTNADEKRLKRSEKIPKNEDKQLRATLIQEAKGQICPGFSYELSRKELNAIMNMESAPISTKQLIRKACEERVRVMRTICLTNEAFHGPAKSTRELADTGLWMLKKTQNEFIE